MFNSIIAELPCPTIDKVASGEIQIKWQTPAKRAGSVYYLGDTLDDIMPEYENVWIKTDFVCEACSRRTESRHGQSFIKPMDQQRHIVFVQIENGTIRQIASEDDFQALKIDNHATDLFS